VLTLLAQILKPKGRALNMDLSPITDRTEILRALTEVLNLPNVPSAGKVVAFDLERVAVDLSAVPLDEVFAFRTEHLIEHRKYARSVREFARELSLMDEDQRGTAFADRQEELKDLASDLRKVGRRAWRAPASFALGLAGATWNYVTGDPLGALLAGATILTGGTANHQNEAGAYSYLFAANRRYA
jgi:hypothetical protein